MQLAQLLTIVSAAPEVRNSINDLLTDLDMEPAIIAGGSVVGLGLSRGYRLRSDWPVIKFVGMSIKVQPSFWLRELSSGKSVRLVIDLESLEVKEV